MATLAHRSRLQLAADPNVIPFIDVLLVLLVIFMVTAPKPTTDLRADLPRPGPAVPMVIPPTIVELRTDAAGYRIFVGAEETSLDALSQSALEHVLAANPALGPNQALAEARLYVRADLDVAYQHVVRVVETLQLAHFRQVAIIAQDADAEP